MCLLGYMLNSFIRTIKFIAEKENNKKTRKTQQQLKGKQLTSTFNKTRLNNHISIICITNRELYNDRGKGGR
jgi:hypothetical protein